MSPAKLCLWVVCSIGMLPAQVGIFEGQSDIGVVSHPGSEEYDSAAKAYTLSSSGENMWAAEDDFHYVWKKLTGDLTLTADIAFPTTTGNAHKKGVLMVRRTLDKDSDYVDAAVHVVGLTSLQSRDQKGGTTREVQSYLPSPKRLRLVKRGDYFFMFVAGADGVFHLSGGGMKLALDESFYVGIGACAHDKDAVEKVVFSNVELEPAKPGSGKPTLYSTLEAVPVQSTDRRSVFVAANRLEGPNWTADGKTLLFTRNGHLERVAAAGGTPEPVSVGKLSHLGSQHGISPDGANLAVTDGQTGKAAVYVLPVTGGDPKRLTKQTPSYWQAWSPDGKTVLYTGTRKGKNGFYTTPVEGGPETQINAGEGVNENPVYSSDGKYIYFDSDRTGTCQIWRMMADGSAQEQITDGADGFANSNPHVSPNGLQVAFVSTDKSGSVQAGDKDMKIRSMMLTTKAIRIIANLVGGDGTFDGEPWSPDSRTLSFVSYQIIPD
jgi:TolB protein